MTTALRGEFQLEREVVVSRGIEEVFRFFSDPLNLQQLSPPWIDLRIVGSSTVVIGAGTLLDYRLGIHGIPIRWRSRILEWNPPHGFADEQVRGPYRSFRHDHSFEAVSGGTRCGDVVRYAVFGGALTNRLFVRRDLERIFDYRTEQLTTIFGA